MIKKHERVFSCAGDAIVPEYKVKLSEDGSMILTQVGEKDLYSFIQSFKDSCSIELIVQRCQLGDYTALSRTQGVYLDTTQFPKTYAEVLQKVIDGKTMFESLPDESRKAYGYNFNKWFMDIGSTAWFSAMGVSVTPEESEVSKVAES